MRIQNPESFKLVQSAIEFKLNMHAYDKTKLNEITKITSYQPRTKNEIPKMLYLFGGQAPKAISKIEIYDFRMQKWLEHTKEMPVKRCRAG